MSEEMSRGLLPECWRHVFSFLGPCSLLECAQVCKRWCEMAHDDRHWLRHARRVRKALGEYHSPTRHQAWPEWKVFCKVLLGPWDMGSSYDGEPFLIDHSLGSASGFGPRMRSICVLPEGWQCSIMHDNAHSTRYHFSFIGYRIDGSRTAVFMALTANGARFATGNIFSRIFYIDHTVDPRQWQRFHSIVRDSDCQGPREERMWFRILGEKE
jgi:hypothetical protein